MSRPLKPMKVDSVRTLPFDLIMADPPWAFGDKLPGNTRGAARNYDTLTVTQLCNTYKLPPVADDAVLFLWKVAAIPEWLDVCRAWGFVPKAELVWVKIGIPLKTQYMDGLTTDLVTVPGFPCVQFSKLAFGMGRRVRNCHEVCVIAQRGKGLEVADRAIRSVFFAPLREHSRKPDEAYRIAERMYPTANRVEVFSRQQRPGWTCLGNEVGKFEEER